MKRFLLSLSLLMSPVMAKEYELISNEKLSAEIGAGYNSETELFAGTCVTGQVAYVGKQESNLDFSQSISQKQLTKELGIAAGGRARMGAITYSASAKFAKKSKSNSFSIASIYTGNYSFKQRKLINPKLNTLGQKLSQHPERFQFTCGDSFAFKQSLGAKIFFSIRIDFTSQQAKQAFEANFSMSGPMASASASLRKAKNTFSKDTKVTVSALQIGGDVSKISDIFYPNAGEVSGPKDFIQCTFGDLTKCENVLENAIKYATDTRLGFPSQIAPEAEINSPTGPAVLKTYAHSYKYMGEYIAFSPALTRTIKKTRQAMNELFEQVYDQYNTAETIINRGIVRLSQKQKDHFIAMESKLYQQMSDYALAIEECYDAPLACKEIYQEFKLGVEGGIELYASKDFEVEKENFAQWCDFSQSAFSLEETRTTVEKLVSTAKEIDPDRFAPAGQDLSIDTCGIAMDILKTQSKLDLSDSKLSDLRPLSTMASLESLNLSGNEIKDISPLKELNNLVDLKLNENKISDISALSKLYALKQLELSDNYISDTTELSKLSSVTYLDLRNNALNIECPYSETSICVIADYRYNNEFIPLETSRMPSRWGHRTTRLENGDLVVTGGTEKNQNAISILSNYDTSFVKTDAAIMARSFHTATALSADEILITGGWGANRSAQLYNHHTKEVYNMAQLTSPRVDHRALKLDDGRVLITGGWVGRTQFWTGRDAQATAELFNPAKNKFEKTKSMRVPRAGHTMTKLGNGQVLIVGGHKVDNNGIGSGISSAEIYDPKFEKFIKLTTRLKYGRSYHSATLLRNGKVLIMGGYTNEDKATNTMEIFDPKTMSFSPVQTLMKEARANHQAVLLPDGKVFAVGGESQFNISWNVNSKCDNCSKTAEIFDPYVGISTKTSSEMNIERSQFSATLTQDNRIIIIGGRGNDARFSASMFEFSKF